MTIKTGYLFFTTKQTIVGDIREGIESCKKGGIVPDSVELNPFYQPVEFSGMKIIFTNKMPVGQIYIGKDEE